MQSIISSPSSETILTINTTKLIFHLIKFRCNYAKHYCHCYKQNETFSAIVRTSQKIAVIYLSWSLKTTWYWKEGLHGLFQPFVGILFSFPGGQLLWMSCTDVIFRSVTQFLSYTFNCYKKVLRSENFGVLTFAKVKAKPCICVCLNRHSKCLNSIYRQVPTKATTFVCKLLVGFLDKSQRPRFFVSSILPMELGWTSAHE